MTEQHYSSTDAPPLWSIFESHCHLSAYNVEWALGWMQHQPCCCRSLRPAAEYRLGRIKATIWANQTGAGEVWFNVQIVRLYLEANQWQESTSFGRDDLPIVAKAADLAFAWIWSQSRQQYSGNGNVGSTTPRANF